MNSEETIKGKKIVVFAPHNDDEILGTGGTIQRYLESDKKVKIAILTNGDGQIRRPQFLPFFRANFVKLGHKRQKESLDALKYLGLKEEDVKFFGYPDRGLSNMWTENWNYENLYYSKYTQTDRSPYGNSFTKNTPYCGSAVAEDIRKLLLEIKPDIIYLPHPNDSHPDHWATNGFVLHALEKLKSEGHEEFDDVKTLCYLVHSVKFPYPRGKFLEATLGKPQSLNKLDTDWIEVSLTLKERLRKLRAIGKYRTQTQLMRKYLISFARANELFGVVPSLSLNNTTHYPATPDLSRDFIVNEKEDEAFLSYLDPKRKSRIATLRRYPDIKEVSLSKDGDVLNLGVDFFNIYRPGNEIQIILKPFQKNIKKKVTGESFTFKFRNKKLYRGEKEIRKGNEYS